MYFTVLCIFGLLFSDAAVKAEDSIPQQYLTQAWQLKQITLILQKTGKPLDAKLFSNIKVTPRISDSEVSFYYYSFCNETGTQIKMSDVKNLLGKTSFNVAYPTVFITHGWLNSYTSDMVKTVKEAYFNHTKNINIFAIDWDTYSSRDYISAFLNVPKVGAYVGEFLDSISKIYSYSLSQVTLVGHSLGAHVSGIAGKATNSTVGTIIGLDPAGPFYFKDNNQTRLASSDAQYVHVIHTDAQFLGLNFDVGTSDFWPNGGWTQPECEMDLFGNCAHGMSYKYFGESVLSQDFLGKQCSDYNAFLSGQCAGEVGQMGGHVIDITAYGNYYLKTNVTAPYGIGLDGIK